MWDPTPRTYFTNDLCQTFQLCFVFIEDQLSGLESEGMWLPWRFYIHRGKGEAILPSASWNSLFLRASLLAKKVHDLSQLLLEMFPYSPQESFASPNSIPGWRTCQWLPTLLPDPVPSQFTSSTSWPKKQNIFLTLKKTCSVFPDGISRVEANRPAFVTVSRVADYRRSPMPGAGPMAGGKVWSVGLG